MRNYLLRSIPNFYAKIKIKDHHTFRISFNVLSDHILLLRQVIDRPELTEEGPLLNQFIKDYCNRMAGRKMETIRQQMNLPLEIEWIWHVHRLHPIAYYNDCTKQLSDGQVLDKKICQVLKNFQFENDSISRVSSMDSHSSFVPSTDLAKAAIRQRGFLEKFSKHSLYTQDLTEVKRSYFNSLVQNYVLFMKLAQKNSMIVPTFDIDLIWHTHMRHPLQYHAASKALCGFVLDHNDAIETNVLLKAYKKTAEDWKNTYNTKYGEDIDRRYLETKHVGGCALVYDAMYWLWSDRDAWCEKIHGDYMLTCSSKSTDNASGGDGSDGDGYGDSGGCGGDCGGCGGD